MSLGRINMHEERCISIRQPWAWLIVNGHKDIENRSWPLPWNLLGERVLVHAGRHFDAAEIVGIFEVARGLGMLNEGGHVTLREIGSQCGGIVGSVRFVGCVRNSTSPWARPGEYHWLIDSPRTQDFRPMRGRLGFFNAS